MPAITHATAQQVIEKEGLIGKLTDKVLLITGGTSGLGLETTRVLYRTGAHIFITARDADKAQQVKQDIEADSSDAHGKLDILTLDMQSLDSVRQCAKDFTNKSKQLHVLICNAGTTTTEKSRTKDGFETTFGVNHVAHFLLFQLLKDTLLASSTLQFNSRVVVVSSDGHTASPVRFDDLDLSKGYDKWIAYGQSKTANIYMSTEIERRYGSRGLHATAIHPGVIFSTNLSRDMSEEEQTKLKAHLQHKGKSVEQGAATQVWAAVSSDWEKRGGKYLEALEVAVPKEQESGEQGKSGYAAHAYDEEAAKRLWDVSLQLVGMKTDEQTRSTSA